MFCLDQDEELNALMDVMKCVAKRVGMIAGDRICEIPSDDFASDGHPCTFPCGLVTQRDDVIEFFVAKLINGFAMQSGCIYVDIGQSSYSTRVDAGWLQARTVSGKTRICVPKQCFC
ncbi:MAG: hypothetical protein A2W79_16490 [Pseudomonadales bacterium RIFCSPLOWO2_12_60_38]|nr:hypothetical protein H098_00420 [Pseudomonas fluorescens FH5]OHC30368.1 MAG: hypothetical protein A2W79_16490 [Pseudomonadales bacterium RIFCSPLOWO2_12_60_38]OHC41648.1 MAG: hypothetical protein A3G72_12620 [Pseudomonadales bacterium RIFCSPLOWO2_12_FULL_59_450]